MRNRDSASSPYKALYSLNEDVTLGNHFGGFGRGRDVVYEQLERAVSYYRDGEPATYETIAKSVGEDLAYTVEIERVRADVGGPEDLSDVAMANAQPLCQEHTEA